MQDTKLPKGNYNPATCVRFSKEEYALILEASKLNGQSIPHLLKDAFFKPQKWRPLMDAKTTHLIMGELRRIGTNVNQIAKKLNSGFRRDWDDPCEKIHEQLSAIRALVAR